MISRLPQHRSQSMGKLTTAKWPRTGHSRGANMLAPIAGVVAELKAVAGAQVAEGTLLVRVEREDG